MCIALDLNLAIWAAVGVTGAVESPPVLARVPRTLVASVALRALVLAMIISKGTIANFSRIFTETEFITNVQTSDHPIMLECESITVMKHQKEMVVFFNLVKEGFTMISQHLRLVEESVVLQSIMSSIVKVES